MLLLTGSQRGLMKMNITIIDIRKKKLYKTTIFVYMDLKHI